MELDFSLISHDILQDVASAIRFIENSSATIAPKDYAERIKEIEKLIPLNFRMPEGGTISLIKTGTPTTVELEYSLDN